MEKTNYEFLCEDLKFLGFGETLNNSLKKGMEEEGTSFELYFAGMIDLNPVDAILYFNKPHPSGYFFLFGFQLALGVKLHQFRIFKGRGVTLKEGYNLLCGRAVFKQMLGKNGQKYDAWIQLDLNTKEGENFKVNTYYESYGFDLSAVLDAFPIETPSVNWDRSMLIKSLQKGNQQAAFLRANEGLKRVFIEANPADRTINIKEAVLTAEDSHADSDDIENVFNKKGNRKKINDR